MKNYKYLYLLFSLLLLIGCVTNTIDTTNKRFAVFESGYSAVLNEIGRLKTADALKPETATRIADALEEVNRARQTANIARKSGDLLNANSALDLAMRALDRLKTSIPNGTQL